MSFDSIYQQALTLSDAEKVELAEMLLFSVNSEDETANGSWADVFDVERMKAWAHEAKQRLEAHDRGETRVFTREEAMSKFRPGSQK
jgi:hypothetical protein